MADDAKNENLVEQDSGVVFEELPRELIDEIKSVDDKATAIAKKEGEIVTVTVNVDEGKDVAGQGQRKTSTKKKTQTKETPYGVWPIEKSKSKITQKYNPSNGHYGVDFGTQGRTGVKVFAYRAGTVVAVVPKEKAVAGSGYNGYGNVVVISHGNKKFSLYGHLASFSVSKGQEVTRGQKIGIAGNTGQSSGIHLHFEVRNAAGYPATKQKPDLEGI